MLYSFDNRQPRIGTETYVSEHALVIGDVEIGNNCYIGHGAILRGDYGSIRIGSGTAVEEGVIIHAPPDDFCFIEEKVTIGHGAIIHAAKIGMDVVIGMGAILSIRSEIGAHTIIAEGSVVRMKQIVPGGVVAGGNPAKVLRTILKKDEDLWGWAKQLYIDLAKKYLRLGMKRL
ncbi:MAG: gamma carbonic anhydrase family protein [Syntrophus sp. (in: bacteria)]|nr:gamma carbonic anhydrase family protein [Syntrophus sp. (in: bacteria)]